MEKLAVGSDTSIVFWDAATHEPLAFLSGAMIKSILWLLARMEKFWRRVVKMASLFFGTLRLVVKLINLSLKTVSDV